MTALVTGGTGLLGSNLIRALRWEGHRVIALVPSMQEVRKSLWVMDDPGVTYIVGGLADANRWAAELDGVDVIFHTTGDAVGVAHLLGWDRDTPEVPVATIHPPAMLGPGVDANSPLGMWILEFLQTGALTPYEGSIRVVDARDVALAMIAAADRRLNGDFVVAGHDVSYDDFSRVLETVTGVHCRNEGTVGMAPASADLSGVLTDLGLPARPYDETVRDLVLWYSERSVRAMVA